MFKNSRFILTLMVVLLFMTTAVQAGQIKGSVLDKDSGEAIIGANVVIVGTTLGAASDLDGNFVILGIKPGTYSVKITAVSYEEFVSENITVTENTPFELKAELKGSTLELKEVTLTAQAETGSEEREIEERMDNLKITDAISSEAMARMPDPDVADAVRRATGVSTMNGNPVIRGLGVRYSKVSLNNSQVAGTEPNKSSVSLELFPSSMMQQVTINKSYTPDQFGEFGGGNINMNTWEIFGDAEIKASAGTSYNTQTTFKKFYNYSGGDLDFLGIDDGTREMPGVVAHSEQKIVRRGGIDPNGPGYSSDEMLEFSRAFSNNWSTSKGTASPNQNYNLSISNSIGEKFSYLLSGVYRNDLEYRDIDRQIFKSGVNNKQELQHYYNFDSYKSSILSGQMAAVRWQIHPLHRIAANTMINRDMSDETRFYTGWNDDAQEFRKDTRLRFVSQSTVTSQLSGNHIIPQLAKTTGEWRVTYSRGTRYEPDTREVQYARSNESEQWVLSDETQSGSRIFNNLVDDTWSGGIDFSTEIIEKRNNSDKNLKVKTGYAFIQRARESETRFFQYKHAGIDEAHKILSPTEIFDPEYLSLSTLYINEETRTTDNYDASLSIGAVYAMFEGAYGKIHYNIGSRYERADQQATSFELFPADPNNPINKVGRLENADFLPAMSLIYSLKSNMNMRLAASRTVSRPDFRELSEFEFTDIIGGHAVVGNPDLKRALITHVDLRYEWAYGNGQLFAVSGFVKRFDNPIETVIKPTAQNQVSYANAESAENYGVEFELRHSLPLFNQYWGDLNISTNFTLLESNISLVDSSGIQTSNERPLQGQSPFLLNIGLNYMSPVTGTQMDMFLHVFGKRIYEVGANGLPDIYEQPHPDLDISIKQPLGNHWAVKFGVGNVIDSEIEFTQGNDFTERYKRGRSISFGITWKN